MVKKKDQRGFIKTNSKLNKRPCDIHEELVKVYGNSAYSYRQVAKWVQHYKRGRETIDDLKRTGRPITKIIKTNIDRVEQLIDQNPRISYSDLEELTSICRGTLHNIIKVKLGFTKKASRWVPHNLTQKNKLQRFEFAKATLAKLKSGQWRLDQILTGDECIFYHRKIGKRQETKTWKRKGEPPDVIVRRDRFEAKTMFSIFFKSTGLVHIHPVESGIRINQEYYIEKCLGPALKAIEKERRKSGLHAIKLLHDGASCHSGKTPVTLSNQKGS